MHTEARDAHLPALSQFLADAMGLHFPPQRWQDLSRAIAGAAPEFGFATDASACARWLATAPLLSETQMQILARHLTVGETYFFRDARQFEILSDHVLPQLIESRRAQGDLRLRIWSAACCTGEEAYSIAILLRRAIADLDNWHIRLLATDIAHHALRKAAAGIFGQWSFRDAPPWLKSQYFSSTADGQFAIHPEIKRLVQFAPLNLVADSYPSLANDTQAMDVIFCRNVLMYFTPRQAGRAVDHLCRAQADGGWLFVSATESLHNMPARYTPEQINGTIIHHKTHGNSPPCRIEMPAVTPPHSAMQPPAVPYSPARTRDNAGKLTETNAPDNPISPPAPDPLAAAAEFHEQGQYAQAIKCLNCAGPSAAREMLSTWAHALANDGMLAHALACCDHWIAADKLNPAAHYLRGLIFHEQGREDEAARSLRQALYLDPEFVVAHFALGNISRARGHEAHAARCFKTAGKLLRGRPPEEVVADSEGITVGQFTEMIQSFTNTEAIS